jgi:hypothetical protein
MRPMLEQDFDTAVALLCEGFPTRNAAFWQAALARLKRYGGNAQADYPIGFFMLDAGQPVGLALTPASLRLHADGSQHCVVNISSWYVREPFRWRAGFMLRGLMADPQHTYTDLTATPELQKVLPKVGMRPLNGGIALHLLPLLALSASTGATVQALQPGSAWPDPACEPVSRLGPPREMIEIHRELGCLPLLLRAPALGTTGTSAPHRLEQALVILRHIRVRNVPAVQLVYAEDRAWVLRHLGALARWLLPRGRMLLACEAAGPRSTATALFRPREVWFVKGQDPDLDRRTDVFGSELCLIHHDGNA